jgi:hypothetical protein
MEVITQKELDAVEVNEMSGGTIEDIIGEMEDDVNSFVGDEHPWWPITEFYAIVNYEKEMDVPGLDVAPISIHGSIEEAKEEFIRKGYTKDYVIVVRQVKTNPEDPNDSYLFDEWDAE